MAEENLRDRAFLDSPHEQRITVTGIDLTGRVMKWSMSPLSSAGAFDRTNITLEKSSQVSPASFSIQSASASQSVVDVIFSSADFATSTTLVAGDYHFQFEVFDGSGNDGLPVATGVMTMVDNLAETI